MKLLASADASAHFMETGRRNDTVKEAPAGVEGWVDGALFLKDGRTDGCSLSSPSSSHPL